MKLNTANRSFLWLVGLAFVPYLLIGLAGCALIATLVLRIQVDGWDALGDAGDIRPALAFFGILLLGIVMAIASILTQVRASLRLRERVRSLRIPTPPSVRDAAARARLRGHVDVLDVEERFSFAYGLLLPRVAVSRALIEASSTRELEAVLAHERYHVRAWDPSKVVLARALPRGLFYLPALAHLRRRYVAGRELAADRRAIRSCGEAALAGALYKVVRGPAWPELAGAAAIGGSELIEARVAQMESGREPPLPGISRTATAVTALGLSLLLALLVYSFVSLDDPFAFMTGGHAFGLDMHGAESTGEHGAWGVAGVALPAALWILGGWWIVRRIRRRPR